MRQYTPILYSVILCGLFLSAGCSGKKENKSELLTKAFEHAEKADWKQSMKYSEHVLSQDKNDVSALLLTVLAMEKSSGNENAILQKAEKAAELAPESFMAQYTYGRLLYRQGKYDRAAPVLKNARRIKAQSGTEDINTVILLAQSMAHVNPNEALSYYKILAKNNRFAKDPVIWNQMGFLYLPNKPDMAVKFLKEAEKYGVSNPKIAWNLAVVNDSYLSNKGEAAVYYHKFMNLVKDNRGAYEAKYVQAESRLRTLR